MKEKTFCMKKNFKPTKNNSLNDVFSNKIVPYYRFLQIFEKVIGF